MLFNKLKSQKGITGIDLTISIIIIMMFVSIIAALSMNVSSSLSSKRRLEIASNCMTEIMEKLDSVSYTSVVVSNTASENTTGNVLEKKSPDDFEREVQEILNENEEYNILTVGIVKEKYRNETDGSTTADLIKKVTVIITYKQNNKDEIMEITRLKTRYNVDLD